MISCNCTCHDQIRSLGPTGIPACSCGARCWTSRCLSGHEAALSLVGSELVLWCHRVLCPSLCSKLCRVLSPSVWSSRTRVALNGNTSAISMADGMMCGFKGCWSGRGVCGTVIRPVCACCTRRTGSVRKWRLVYCTPTVPGASLRLHGDVTAVLLSITAALLRGAVCDLV